MAPTPNGSGMKAGSVAMSSITPNTRSPTRSTISSRPTVALWPWLASASSNSSVLSLCCLTGRFKRVLGGGRFALGAAIAIRGY